ncbi:MAG: hypothetical protein JJE35_05860 [Thermoleophilia bacterium]|nr:hypothetical protein [Thermoleophilia bacterium]
MSTALAERTEQRLTEGEFDWDADAAPVLVRAEELAHDEGAFIRDSFEDLADELEQQAAGLSATRRAFRYPAFIEILALGDAVIPEVIERLKTSENRPLWLRVLGSLTPFPPGAGESTIDDAADAWIRWGRRSSELRLH